MSDTAQPQSEFRIARRTSCLSTLTLALTGPVWLRALASRRWSTTTGCITSSTLVAGQGLRTGPFLVPDIRYEHKVAGTRYESHTVQFSYTAYQPAETTAKYTVGKQVTVYYNPHSPKKAVLEPGIPRGDVRRAAYPFVFALIACAIIWSALWTAPATKIGEP